MNKLISEVDSTVRLVQCSRLPPAMYSTLYLAVISSYLKWLWNHMKSQNLLSIH